MARPGKDEIIKTLLEFFFDEFAEDAAAVGEWLAQGGQDIDQFFHAAQRLKRELTLRD